MLDVIIGRHTWNCQIRTHIHTGYTHTGTHTQKKQKEKVERLERLGGKKKEKLGKPTKKKEMGSQERKKEGKEKEGRKEKGGMKEENERKGGKEKKEQKNNRGREMGLWGRGARVLRRAGPHTNNARST